MQILIQFEKFTVLKYNLHYFYVISTRLTKLFF